MGKKIVSKEWSALQREGRSHFEREGFSIEGQTHSGQVYLVTSVFEGETYIPRSVRRCLQGESLRATGPHFGATLLIDEPNFRVLLLLQTDIPQGQEAFDRLLSEFLEIAHEWHSVLDEYGGQDLVYVPVTS